MSETNALLDLVNYEKSTTRIRPVINSISFRGSYTDLRNLSKTKILIRTSEKVYQTSLDDKFIAQIVKRISDKDRNNLTNDAHSIRTNESEMSWRKSENFSNQMRELKTYLHYNLNNNYDVLCEKLIKEISNLDIISDSDNDIYGFVSSAYKPKSQLEFRENFLRLCKEYDDRIDTSKSLITLKYGRITEIFDYNIDSADISLKCGLVYGRNNGYGSYYVTWHREFTETKSKLTPFITESKFNWQNNPRRINSDPDFTLENFTLHVVDEGKHLLNACDEIANNAQNSLIDSTLIMECFDNILSKIACASASKERVKNHYIDLYINIKNKRNFPCSIYAIAHTLCFTGTHEKAIPFSMRELMITAGSELLKDGFERFENTYSKNGIKVNMKIQ